MLTVLVSCTSRLEKLETEVMELHDEVMPLMDSLYKIRMQLQLKAETDSTRVELTESINEIMTAEEAMMNWMRNYNPSFNGADDAESVLYFSDQKASIEQVADQMKEAMATGEGIINNF